MSNIYLTCCALSINAIICILFFCKERVTNIETKIYGAMLLLSILESIITTSIVIVAITYNSIPILKLLNRIDIIIIITWCSLMFYYILNVANRKIPKWIKIIIIIFIKFFNSFVINIIDFIFIILPVYSV